MFLRPFTLGLVIPLVSAAAATTAQSGGHVQ